RFSLLCFFLPCAIPFLILAHSRSRWTPRASKSKTSDGLLVVSFSKKSCHAFEERRRICLRRLIQEALLNRHSAVGAPQSAPTPKFLKKTICHMKSLEGNRRCLPMAAGRSF